MANQSSRPLHLLLLPLSTAQGHLTPMLALAEMLLAEGCIITCVLTEHSHHAMLDAGAAESQFTGLHFVTIPNASFESMSRPEDKLAAILEAMMEQQGFLERLIESSKSSESPISCIIADMALPWAQDVANKCSILCVILWTCSAAVLVIGRVAEAGGLKPGDRELKELQQKLHIMNDRSILEFFPQEDSKFKEMFLSFHRRLDEHAHILINTFGSLEGHLLPLLPPNARFIGPCLPLHATVNEQSDQYHHGHLPLARLGSMIKEDMPCLSWLDKQEDFSVIFISFGSSISLPHAQIFEIALGMEASNHKFIWVARQDKTLDASSNSPCPFPEGFLERTKDRGLVISWAPQLQVLKHRAIGGFLTHCGWNSTLESMFMGVPMLCFPIFGDQTINEEIIMMGAPHECIHGSDDHGQQATDYGVGLGFKGRHVADVKSNYVVSREEVKEAVRTLLGGDIGVKLRKNAHQLKDHARSDLVGSSHTALCSMIDDIRRANCP